MGLALKPEPMTISTGEKLRSGVAALAAVFLTAWFATCSPPTRRCWWRPSARPRCCCSRCPADRCRSRGRSWAATWYRRWSASPAPASFPTWPWHRRWRSA
ncbi:MAG: hypothetical protein MZW92_01500 [Comamonadaceae bacterium]|nr:hypothetical protein [Comamonadaceae bacterium]